MPIRIISVVLAIQLLSGSIFASDVDGKQPQPANLPTQGGSEDGRESGRRKESQSSNGDQEQNTERRSVPKAVSADGRSRPIRTVDAHEHDQENWQAAARRRRILAPPQVAHRRLSFENVRNPVLDEGDYEIQGWENFRVEQTLANGGMKYEWWNSPAQGEDLRRSYQGANIVAAPDWSVELQQMVNLFRAGLAYVEDNGVFITLPGITINTDVPAVMVNNTTNVNVEAKAESTPLDFSIFEKAMNAQTNAIAKQAETLKAMEPTSFQRITIL